MKMAAQDSSCTLSDHVTSILLSPVGWLNDSIITATQNLLKMQTSLRGFQSPMLGNTYGFNVQRDDFIQILHDGHGHWLTVSNIGATSHNEILCMIVFTLPQDHTQKPDCFSAVLRRR